RAARLLGRTAGARRGGEEWGGECVPANAAQGGQAGAANGAGGGAGVDVGFHHGNGTQDLCYDRADVLFASFHGEPPVSYPYFSGYADERGIGAGEGFNLNLPLPKGTLWDTYSAALDHAAAAIAAHAPDALVVSLGVDTFEHDPISHFRLRSPDYLRIGAALARLDVPTLFVMEGGYMVDEIGVNAVNVLLGFEGRA
ncbi:histone deacetylase family protein, partial [Burkholderia contaminans]